MAEFLVRNPRDESEAYLVTIGLRQVKISTDDPAMEGELSWILEMATMARDCDDNLIQPKIKHLLSFETIDADINSFINDLCKEICWATDPDVTTPSVYSTDPEDGEEDVELDSSLIINLIDQFPSAGIDLSTIKLYFKGFDVTDKLYITGNPFQYTIKYTPGTKGASV